MKILSYIHSYDVVAFEWFLRRHRRELFVKFSRWISRSADGPLYVVSGLCFVLMKNWPMATLFAMGFTIERCFYFLFKKLFKRNRPPAAIPGFSSVIEPSDKFSFPSGHTSGAFFMATAMTLVFPALALCFYLWAALVGLARVTLGVHFPTDTLAGALMGSTICSALAWQVL